MNEEQVQHIIETTTRTDERVKVLAEDFKGFKEAVVFRLATVERKQAGTEMAFEKQRALCRQRLDGAEKLRRPWYIAIVSLIIGAAGGLLSRLIWRA